MGLLVRGHDEIHVSLFVAAAQAADTNLAAFRLPAGPGWWLKDLQAKLIAAGITDVQTVDINKNGTSLIGGTKISFATTSATPTYPTLGEITADPGDIISVDNDAVHSGTPGEGLIIDMVWTRIPQAGVTNSGPGV